MGYSLGIRDRRILRLLCLILLLTFIAYDYVYSDVGLF